MKTVTYIKPFDAVTYADYENHICVTCVVSIVCKLNEVNKSMTDGVIVSKCVNYTTWEKKEEE